MFLRFLGDSRVNSPGATIGKDQTPISITVTKQTTHGNLGYSVQD
jgi:hypothetical protein